MWRAEGGAGIQSPGGAPGGGVGVRAGTEAGAGTTETGLGGADAVGETAHGLRFGAAPDVPATARPGLAPTMIATDLHRQANRISTLYPHRGEQG